MSWVDGIAILVVLAVLAVLTYVTRNKAGCSSCSSDCRTCAKGKSFYEAYKQDEAKKQARDTNDAQ